MELKRMTREDYPFLFELLKEKTPEQNISFVMPTWEEHVAFNDKHLDAEEYIIWEDGERAGRVYLTSRDEIGIHVSQKFRGRGLASQAIGHFLKDKPILANINPLNTPSIKLFEKKGFKLLQHTYKWTP